MTTIASNYDSNVTIMKYQKCDGTYDFKVLDKFDEPDEVKRLELMIFTAAKMKNEGLLKKRLWIKTVPTI